MKSSASAAPVTSASPSSVPKTSAGILSPGAADKILPLGAPPKIRVIAPGDEPRLPFAYAFSKGEEAKLTIALDLSMGMKSGIADVPATAMPRMAISLSMTSSEWNADGDAKIDATVLACDVQAKDKTQEQIAAAIKPQLDSVKGLSLSYWMTPQGHVHDLKINGAESAAGAAQQAMNGLNQSFESMALPLPNAPVGVGAAWEVISRVANSGADLLQYATYSMRSRDGSKAKIDVSLVQVAASADVHAPGFPPSVSARMKAFKSAGSGSTDIDTKSIAVLGGSLGMGSSMALEVSQTGVPKSESVDVETKLKMQFLRPAK